MFISPEITVALYTSLLKFEGLLHKQQFLWSFSIHHPFLGQIFAVKGVKVFPYFCIGRQVQPLGDRRNYAHAVDLMVGFFHYLLVPWCTSIVESQTPDSHYITGACYSQTSRSNADFRIIPHTDFTLLLYDIYAAIVI